MNAKSKESHKGTLSNKKQIRRFKANIRERNRMHGLNRAMDDLRTRMPLHWTIVRHQKLSKIETLRLARNYIVALDKMLKSDMETKTCSLEYAEILAQGMSQTTTNLIASVLNVPPRILQQKKTTTSPTTVAIPDQTCSPVFPMATQQEENHHTIIDSTNSAFSSSSTSIRIISSMEPSNVTRVKEEDVRIVKTENLALVNTPPVNRFTFDAFNHLPSQNHCSSKTTLTSNQYHECWCQNMLYCQAYCNYIHHQSLT